MKLSNLLFVFLALEFRLRFRLLGLIVLSDADSSISLPVHSYSDTMVTSFVTAQGTEQESDRQDNGVLPPIN
jgi:hypothetical protein